MRGSKRQARLSRWTSAYFPSSSRRSIPHPPVGSPWPRASQDEQVAGQDPPADPPFHARLASIETAAQPLRALHRADAPLTPRPPAQGAAIPARAGWPGCGCGRPAAGQPHGRRRAGERRVRWPPTQSPHRRRPGIELRLAVKRGKLVDAQEVELLWSRRVVATRDKLLGIPSKLKGRRPALLRDDVLAVDVLIRECLEELASDGAGDGAAHAHLNGGDTHGRDRENN